MCNNAASSNAILHNARHSVMCNFAAMDEQIAEVRRYVDDLTSKTGLSYSALADLAGVSPTTVTRFMNKKAVAHVLSTATLGKLRSAAARHLAGQTAPTESADPPRLPGVADIAPGAAPSNVRPGASVEIPDLTVMSRDLPIYGTAAGSNGDGAFFLNFGDMVDRAFRPPSLKGNTKAYGLYVEGQSMAPAFEHGSFIVADPTKKVRPGDYVVVVIMKGDDEHSEPMAYIKEFVKQTATELHLKQHNPPMPLVFPRSRVVPESMHRLLTLAELMGVG
jgi:SOS-response transcriptional repressor LexA